MRIKKIKIICRFCDNNDLCMPDLCLIFKGFHPILRVILLLLFREIVILFTKKNIFVNRSHSIEYLNKNVKRYVKLCRFKL